MKVRVYSALIRAGQILMVQHVQNGRTYWTLPGGGVEEGEAWENAAVREVLEETKSTTTVARRLFDGPFTTPGGYDWEACFLVEMTDENQIAALGFDPEESHLEESARMLQAVAWVPLDQVRDDGQVSAVLSVLQTRP